MRLLEASKNRNSLCKQDFTLIFSSHGLSNGNFSKQIFSLLGSLNKGDSSKMEIKLLQKALGGVLAATAIIFCVQESSKQFGILSSYNKQFVVFWAASATISCVFS
jgi:hypothetical protein